MQAHTLSERTIIWKGIFYRTIEYCRISHQDHNTLINGTITGMAETQPVNIQYQISLDNGFNPVSFLLRSTGEKEFQVVMFRRNEKWYDKSGQHQAQFDGCADIDIALTPFTNTIPIERLHLKTGESGIIDVVYIDPLEGKLSPAQQRYTRLEVGRYRYESLSTKFVSELSVDSDGIVLNYPGLWEMIYPEKPVNNGRAAKKTPHDFVSALVSGDRSPEIDDSSDIYAGMLGSWDMKVIDYNPDDGTKTPYRAKWYFSRVLEGRAIQDVFVCPEFTERSVGMSKIGNRYGSSFRMFDAKTKQWRVDWFNPVTGVHNQLVARNEGDRIVQETDEIDGLIMRWVFDDIQLNSFHWYGVNSTDKGKTWKLSVEFFAKRYF